MLKQFKTAVLAAIAIVLSIAIGSCTNEDLDSPNQGTSSSDVTVAWIKDGKVVYPKSRADFEGASKALSFSSKEALNSHKAYLSTLGPTERLNFIEALGVRTIYTIAEEADEELEKIGSNSNSEIEFRQKYNSLVEKYTGRLVTNNQDETDLNLYVPEDNDMETYYVNDNLQYVVDGQVYKQYTSGQLSEADAAMSRSGNYIYTPEVPELNSVSYSPKSGKKVHCFAYRGHQHEIMVQMNTRKQMWYGWKDDNHRDYMIEGSVSGLVDAPSYFWYYLKRPKKNFRRVMLGHGTYNKYVAGTIDTWTDMTADYNPDGSAIYEIRDGVKIPQFSTSKSRKMTVSLKPIN